MEEEWLTKGSKQYDLMIIDAFSGDAIPFHLMTMEAMSLFNKHLKQKGTIAFHISNTYINLAPVVQGLAEYGHCAHHIIYNRANLEQDMLASAWSIVSCDPNLKKWLQHQDQNLSIITDAKLKAVIWSDDKNSILPLLRWN